MNDIEGSRPVSWLRDLFEDASAESMYRWVLVAWLVVVVAVVVLDRMGASLLGRTRPLVQHPPVRARAWRWGRKTPPADFSPLPPGTIAPEPNPRLVARESIPLVPRYALEAGSASGLATPVLPEMPWLSDGEFWRAIGDDTCPIFGVENNERLAEGLAPERFNPVSGRVETLNRHAETGVLSWPDATTTATATIGRRLVDGSGGAR